MRMQRRLFFLVGVIGALVLGPVPVAQAADTPVDHGAFSFPLDETDSFLCPFPLQISGQVLGSFTSFLDDAGNINKMIIHSSNEFTVSANGVSVPQTERWNDIILFDDSGNPVSETIAGLIVHFRLPHGGTVGLDVGRMVENPMTGEVLFQAGNFQLAGGDTAALCAAFG